MKYQNTKTGAIFDSPCIVSGGNWIKVVTKITREVIALENIEPEEVRQESIQEETEQQETEVANEVEVPKEITRVQIMQELDAEGIEYDKKANKQTLYNLMMQGK